MRTALTLLICMGVMGRVRVQTHPWLESVDEETEIAGLKFLPVAVDYRTAVRAQCTQVVVVVVVVV